MEASQQTFDAFFSYNSLDQSAVEAVAARLRARGLSVFLDRWYLVPGKPWPRTLERLLGSCRAVVVFLGPSGMGRWQQSEVYLALDRQTANADFSVIPILLPGSDPALGFLSLNTWVDLRENIDDDVAVGVLEAAIRGPTVSVAFGSGSNDQTSGEVQSSICPYRGLMPFREEDAPFFFGREVATDNLRKSLDRHPMVALVGASGSGKSSVVRAGLVPQLRHQSVVGSSGLHHVSPGSVWSVATFYPTENPLAALASSLLQLLEPEIHELERILRTEELARHMATGRVTLRGIVARVLEKLDGTDCLLLVADQWEELYTLCRDESIRRCFIDQLIDASKAPALRVLLTLRGDFFGELLGHRLLVDHLSEGIVKLPPMNRDELIRAVGEPARQTGLRFEPGLADRIVDDVECEPGSLPLLQFALASLWDRRVGSQLRHQTYESIGQVQGALALRAEEFYSRLSEPERDDARRIFVQLVSPGDGNDDTRRRATMSELGESARPLIRRLADQRFVVTARDETSEEETVELAHEAVIRHWKRMRDWMESDRSFRCWQERLRTDIRQWQESGCEDAALLRGRILSEAESHLQEQPERLTTAERDFIQACLDVRNQLEVSRRKRASMLLVGLSTALLFVASAAVFGWLGRKQALDAQSQTQRQSRIAKVQRLAAQAQAALSEFPQRGLILAAEAVQRSRRFELRVPQAEQAVRDGLSRCGGIVVASHEGPVTTLALSTDGLWLATGSGDGTARLWTLSANPSHHHVREFAHSAQLDDVAFVNDNRDLLTARWGDVKLWDLGGTALDARLSQLPAHIEQTLICADQRLLLVRDRTDIWWAWDLDLDDALVRRPLASPAPSDVFLFDPTARRWATTDPGGVASNGSIQLWTVDDAGLPRRDGVLSGHEQAVVALAMSSNDRWLLSGSHDGTARVWDLQSSDPSATCTVLPSGGGPIANVCFSSDNRWAIAVDESSTARLWDLNDRHPPIVPKVLRIPGVEFDDVATSPDGRWLLAYGATRAPLLADLTAPELGAGVMTLHGHEDSIWPGTISPDRGESINDAKFTADSGALLTAGDDGFARLWDLATIVSPACPMVLRGVVETIDRLAVGPRGRWICVLDDEGTSELWDLSRAESRTHVVLHHRGEYNVQPAFSSNGRWLLTADRFDTGTTNAPPPAGVAARVWDLNSIASEQQPLLLPGHSQAIRHLTFSPHHHWAITVSDEPSVRIWDLSSPHEPSVIAVLPHHDNVSAVAVAADDSFLVTACDDGSTYLWPLQRSHGEPAAVQLSGHNAAITCAEISRDGRWVVTGSTDGAARLWNLPELERQRNPIVLRGHTSWVTGLALTPNQRWLITSSDDATVRLWDLTTRDPQSSMLQLAEHEGPIWDLAVSADGRWLATGTVDRHGTVRIWDLSATDVAGSVTVIRTGTHLMSVDFAANSRRLVTGQGDGSLRFWNLEMDDLLEQAKRATARNLTRGEWNSYLPDEPYRKTFDDLPEWHRE